MNWNLVLDYVRVLIWPIVAMGLAVVFRQPLRGLVGRIRKAGAAGVEVEFDQAEEVLRRADEALEASQQPAVTSSEDDDKDIIDTEQADTPEEEFDDSWPEPALTTLVNTQLAETARRKAINEVLVEGIRLGWEYAKFGEAEPPRFELTWSLSGHPQIKNLTGDVAARVLAARDYTNHIQNAIMRNVDKAETRLSESRWRGVDFEYKIDNRSILVIVNPVIDNADILHQAHDIYSLAKTSSRGQLMGMIFICRSRPPQRMDKIFKLLWPGDEVKYIRRVRWVDRSDDDELLTAFFQLDDEIPPF
ncbi:hypothetical protein [Acrocarpospora catenulata]|uniref:hypothetical protein n=1 Tax=Acrocarpospora catenulata TaxID=2836182 RepID=UPI001BDB402B|nr:hypothetical protein [Acrocarpospora catenulata]